MKVYNLQCEDGHSFEGWFRSEDDFISQNKKGLFSCPICENSNISRIPSAAHIQSNKAKDSGINKNNSIFYISLSLSTISIYPLFSYYHQKLSYQISILNLL